MCIYIFSFCHVAQHVRYEIPSSLIRDRTDTPCTDAQILNHWTSKIEREFF